MKAWRRALCSGLVALLLFAQWAVAAYACPTLSSSGGASARQAQPMSGACEDIAAPNLCAEHCKAGQQSDHTMQVSVPAAVLRALYALVPSLAAGPTGAPGEVPERYAVGALPHSILHCCLRI